MEIFSLISCVSCPKIDKCNFLKFQVYSDDKGFTGKQKQGKKDRHTGILAPLRREAGFINQVCGCSVDSTHHQQTVIYRIFNPKNNHKNPFVLAFFSCDQPVSKSQLILLWKCFIVKLIFFKGMLLLLLLLSAVGVAESEQCEADREYHSGC